GVEQEDVVSLLGQCLRQVTESGFRAAERLPVGRVDGKREWAEGGKSQAQTLLLARAVGWTRLVDADGLSLRLRFAEPSQAAIYRCQMAAGGEAALARDRVGRTTFRLDLQQP